MEMIYKPLSTRSGFQEVVPDAESKAETGGGGGQAAKAQGFGDTRSSPVASRSPCIVVGIVEGRAGLAPALPHCPAV